MRYSFNPGSQRLSALTLIIVGLIIGEPPGTTVRAASRHQQRTNSPNERHKYQQQQRKRQSKGNYISVQRDRRRKLQSILSDIIDDNDLNLPILGNTDQPDEDLYEPQKRNGDPQCPCLTADDLINNYFYLNYTSANAPPALLQYEELVNLPNRIINATSYGIGCRSHDEETPKCQTADPCITTIPLPYNCDQSWCVRSWCYVDTTNCGVDHEPTAQWLDVSYSYATCGHMDTVTHIDRRKSLEQVSLKVALNHNTGGWMGAYHPLGRSFVTDSEWSGPVVRFMTDAALSGDFTIDITRPPLWLKSEAEKFFGNSSFDYCVYATALGYLDVCVGDYTITSQRAAVTSFFELKSNPIYLVVFTTVDQDMSWDYFVLQFWTIFQPFTKKTWAVIMFGVLPLLGLVMWYHEYDAAGSVFPTEYQVQIKDKVTGRVIGTETRSISVWYRLAKTLYMSFLGLCGGGYDVVVISVGGKVHLLAILSFLALALAVYTANLAAILTSNIQRNAVDSLEEALYAKYKFCAARQVGDVVAEIHDLDPEEWIVPDPVSFGGDGQPSFDCPRCNARTRVFDQMKYNQDDPLYCDAAFVLEEDLQVLHQYALHCNKTVVGEVLGYTTSGIPIHSRVAPQLTAWLYDRKYQGNLGEIYKEAMPDSRCPAKEDLQEEGVGLSVLQLAGIWGIVGSLMIAGLVTKAINSYFRRRNRRSNKNEVLKYINCDQWGNAVDNPNIVEEEDANKEAESLMTMDHIAFQTEESAITPLDARSLGGGTSPDAKG